MIKICFNIGNKKKNYLFFGVKMIACPIPNMYIMQTLLQVYLCMDRQVDQHLLLSMLWYLFLKLDISVSISS